MEYALKRLTEYFNILSKTRRYPYHVFIDYTTLFGERQPIVFVYKNTGRNIFIEYCYPLSAEQYNQLELSEVKGFQSKNMASGHKIYLDFYFAYASLEFSLDQGLDFDTAFGYIIRSLERHLITLMEDIK